MALLSQITDNHGADHALSVHDCTGNPPLTVAVDLFDYLQMQSVKPLRNNVRGSGAKIYDRQHLRGGQLEVLRRGYPLGEGLRDLHLTIDQLLISFPAMKPQRQPELE